MGLIYSVESLQSSDDEGVEIQVILKHVFWVPTSRDFTLASTAVSLRGASLASEKYDRTEERSGKLGKSTGMDEPEVPHALHDIIGEALKKPRQTDPTKMSEEKNSEVEGPNSRATLDDDEQNNFEPLRKLSTQGFGSHSRSWTFNMEEYKEVINRKREELMGTVNGPRRGRMRAGGQSAKKGPRKFQTIAEVSPPLRRLSTGASFRREEMANLRRCRSEGFFPFVRSINRFPVMLLSCKDEARLNIVYFHASDVNLKHLYMELVYTKKFLRANIFAMEFPGFGIARSMASNPNKELTDNLAYRLVAYLTEEMNVDPSTLVFWGCEIGAGVALHLASTLYKEGRPVPGVIMQSPPLFASFEEKNLLFAWEQKEEYDLSLEIEDLRGSTPLCFVDAAAARPSSALRRLGEKYPSAVIHESVFERSQSLIVLLRIIQKFLGKLQLGERTTFREQTIEEKTPPYNALKSQRYNFLRWFSSPLASWE